MPLIAYDRSGNVMAVIDDLVLQDEDGVFRSVDFEATEAADVKLRELWEVSGASGSTSWPEHLGERFLEFRVKVDKRFNLRGRELAHRGSGHARKRDAIEAAVVRRVEETEVTRGRRVVDVRPLLGDPSRPLPLDKDGRDIAEADRDAERVGTRGPSGARFARRPQRD